MRAAAVAFDLDDTLVDHAAAARRAIAAYLADRGWPAGTSVADRWISLERRHFADYVAGRVDFAEHRRRRLHGILDHVGAIREAALPDAVVDAEFTDYLDRTGLTPYVELLLTVADVPAPKPDPRAFTTLCERLAATPTDVLFVGDDVEIDVVGASRAGLHAVHLDRMGVAPAGAHPRISTLDELAVSRP